MSKCPKCGKNIKYLLAYTEKKYTLEIDEKGKEKYEEHYEIDIPISFECPECCEEIFTDEAKAIDFLKREKKK